MLTPDEVRAVPLFASLSDADVDRLVRSSEDIRLHPGEYAVHEGGERALYAVLSGKFEVVKHFDGVERTLGWRLPGTIFGEVPLAFATPFPGGYRAAEPSRVMRVEPHHYFAIASSAPQVAEKVGALARERIGGLQAAPSLRQRSARWCACPTAACCSSRRCASWPSAWAYRRARSRPNTTR